MGGNKHAIKKKTLSFISFSLLLASLATAQVNYDIKLKSGVIHTEANAALYTRQMAMSRTESGPSQVLLQFHALPGERDEALLNSAGITILDYVNANAFTVLLAPGMSEDVVNRFSIRSITEMQPEWKAEPLLWKKIDADPAAEVELQVSFLKEVDAAAIKLFLAGSGASLVSADLEKMHLYKVRVRGSQVRQLARWYGVRYIGPAPVYAPLDAEANAGVNAASVTAPLSLGGGGLTGEGVSVGVGDNVSGIYHIDLIDRIINYNPARMTNHGQHINGIVGGAGIIDPKATGAAPKSILVDHIYDNVLANTGAMRAAHNMSITNNSYATVILDTGYAGRYDGSSYALDELSLQYTDVLHVFAAGNDGFQFRPPYPMGYGTVCGGYQPAKNALVVNNYDKHYWLGALSSSGPVRDGRLRPELSCIGDGMLSTRGVDIYLVAGGTSMASPQVAGAAALLTERYRQIHGNVNPRADVLKAVLLNGAHDFDRPGPDYRVGYGILNVARSKQMIDSNRIVTNTIANGGQQSFTINVPANTAQLKVMLCYHDQPGSPIGDGRELVNDLDIEVTEPNSTIHLPLVLNTDIPNVLDLAVEGRDSLNNTEQVTINNPAAGTYTITVKGHDIPQGSQPYVVAYNFDPLGVKIKNPVRGTSVAHNDSLCIYWDASADANPLTLEYTTNNGGSWTTIATNIPDSQKYYIWYVPGVTSEQCKVRLSRNNTSYADTSGSFVISAQPQVYVDSAALCAGYIKVNWPPVPGATGYVVMRKHGWYMEQDATITDTTYTYSGLDPDSMYYIAVQPLINGEPGYRSIAVKRRPDSGPCNGTISDGDLMVEAIREPVSGRLQTSTQLSASETMIVRVRNLDNAPSGNYTLHYAVNGNWQTQNGTGIPATGFTDITINGLNLAAPGAYTLQAAIEHTGVTDNVSRNDSATVVVRQLVNSPVSLPVPLVEGFETFGVTVVQGDTMGLSPDERWDYTNNLRDSGRLRTYVNDSFLVTGNRSVTMDMTMNSSAGTQNYFMATYNMTLFDTTSDEVRVDFDYILHAQPKFYDGNEFSVRGSDLDAWIPVFHYDTSLDAGVLAHSNTISLTQALRAASQNFSSSFQVRFGQNDTSLVASRSYGNGFTFDNFRLYTLQKDVQLLSVLSPARSACGSGGQQPVSIRVYNSVSQVQNDVVVSYQLDGGAVVNETITTIAGYDTIDYVFSQQLPALPFGDHVLSVWLAAPGDSLQSNDSIMNQVIHSQPLITTYPFAENFETNNGYWYAEGLASTWEWGVPAATLINNAGSGTRAWVTNLDGFHNNLEKSYLYTTCFDISSLDSPTVAFKLITDIEDCGTMLCDGAYLEYTYNGVQWTKLGEYGQGIGWYTDSTHDVWDEQSNTEWKLAQYALPVSNQPVRFRFVFSADPATNREGIGVDSFSIFNYTDSSVVMEPFEGLVVYPNPNTDGVLKVKWSGTVGDKMQVVIIDVAGRVVFREDHIANNTVNNTTLHTGRMMTGIYVVKIIINDRQYFKKVLMH
ncbi:MAG: S8 family peptidase [Flavipsychrobacter sp.]|nr:S8 family peptidase [Flavipsychrobacter sp.]